MSIKFYMIKKDIEIGWEEGRGDGKGLRTLRYSFVISWYSLVIVAGGGRATMRAKVKSPKETRSPIMV